jgi:hypothetical protein
MMNYGKTPRLSLPWRHPVAALLGLAAIILGILGMHIFNGNHHGPASTAQPAAATAAADHTLQDHMQDSTAVLPTEPCTADAAGCTGPCGDGHDLMGAVCVLMVVVTALAAILVPQRFRWRNRHGLHGPPNPLALALPVLRPPSLVQLSVSRT